MYPIITPIVPPKRPVEDRYLYQQALYEQHRRPSSIASDASSDRAYAAVPSASDDRIRRSLDQPQTVEQIVSDGVFSVPKAAPETALIADRMHTSWLGLDDIIDQVRQRYAIYRRNVYELKLAQCAAMSEAFLLDAQMGPAGGEQQYVLNKRMQDLYGQQRLERVSLWRDISTLRLALPESAQQYLAALRKLSLLESPEGGDGW